tara:strand:+ start:1526 stop:2131 length:606 start_codon:yes stop_codon:yes gene_type:complete
MTDITFPYWGPLVTKAALDVQTMSTLSEKMHTAKDYFHHDITSLENEFNFNKEEIDNVNLLLQPYFESYRSVYEKSWALDKLGPFTCTNAWVNYQQQREWRPPHFHSNCDASFVVYMSVPKQLEHTNKNIAQEYTPGSIVFEYNKHAQYKDKLVNLDSCTYLPEDGDIVIFPSTLRHYSVPFTTEATRISISGNINIEELT